MPNTEQNHKNNLSRARDAYKSIKEKANPIMSGIKEARRAAGLMKNLDPLWDWLFGIALTLAMLKDVLDFVGFGSLPAIGTAVTLCVSFSIGLIMFLTGSRKKAKAVRGMGKEEIIKKFGSVAKRFGVLGAGTGAEMFFGINFFPIETAIVIIVFYMTLRDREIAKENEEKENQTTQQAQQQAPAQEAA